MGVAARAVFEAFGEMSDDSASNDEEMPEPAQKSIVSAVAVHPEPLEIRRKTAAIPEAVEPRTQVKDVAVEGDEQSGIEIDPLDWPDVLEPIEMDPIVAEKDLTSLVSEIAFVPAVKVPPSLKADLDRMMEMLRKGSSSAESGRATLFVIQDDKEDGEEDAKPDAALLSRPGLTRQAKLEEERMEVGEKPVIHVDDEFLRDPYIADEMNAAMINNPNGTNGFDKCVFDSSFDWVIYSPSPSSLVLRLIDWLIDWLTVWWIHRLIDWLIDGWIDWLMDGWIDGLIDWLIDWSEPSAGFSDKLSVYRFLALNINS